MRILIIEDEQDLATPVQLYFQKQNFVVDYAADGKEGYQLASINNYDCIILDLNLPFMDGLQVCQKLREQEVFTPILMLTARRGTAQTISGFEHGADDYLTKPFSMKELLLRVNALIRRNSSHNGNQLNLGELEINPAAHGVTLGKKHIDLNNKEFSTLEYLARHQGRVVSQEELLEHVWGEDVDPFTQTVKTTIKTLRQKVDPHKTLIKTIRGQGYIISQA